MGLKYKLLIKKYQITLLYSGFYCLVGQLILFHVSPQPFLPTELSANISVSRRGCSTHFSATLQTEGEEKGSLTLQLACQPGLSLKASVQHSAVALQTLGLPTRGAMAINVSTEHLPAAEVDLEMGRCSFRGRLGKAESPGRDEERPSYVVNVTNFCPALQV